MTIERETELRREDEEEEERRDVPQAMVGVEMDTDAREVEEQESPSEELLKVFGVGAFPDPSFVEKCLKLCRDFSLSADALHNTWEAYAMRVGASMTDEGLEDVRRELVDKFGMVTHADGMGRRGQEEATLRKTAERETGGRKWRKGKRAGVVLQGVGREAPAVRAAAAPVAPVEGTEMDVGDGKKKRVQIRLLDRLTKPYRHLSKQVMPQADALFLRLLSVTQQVIEAQKWDNIDQANMTSSVPMNVVGMLYPDERHANPDSASTLELEVLTPDHTSVIRTCVRPRLSMPPKAPYAPYSLVPGNVVALRGVNYDGTTLIIDEILPLPRAPSATVPVDAEMKVVVFAGPFHDDIDNDGDDKDKEKGTPAEGGGDWNFESPLAEMGRIVTSERPDVMILLGPFMDADTAGRKQGKNDDAFGVFMNAVQGLAVGFEGGGCQVVYLPSTEDAVFASDGDQWNVVPQPVFSAPISALRCPNPATITISSIPFHLTTLELYTKWTQSETVISTTSTHSPPRMRRIVAQMLEQGTLVNPMLQELLDLPHWGERCLFEGGVMPRVIVAPSVLNPFVMFVEGTLVINPGRIMRQRGQGGTYARLWIFPQDDRGEGQAENDQKRAQGFEERCRAEVVGM